MNKFKVDNIVFIKKTGEQVYIDSIGLDDHYHLNTGEEIHADKLEFWPAAKYQKFKVGNKVFCGGDKNISYQISGLHFTHDVIKYSFEGHGDLLYNERSLTLAPPAPIPSKPPAQPEPIVPVVAMRFNTGKPELSYILDFPKALNEVVKIDQPPFGIIEDLQAFKKNQDTAYLSCIIKDLFCRLEKDLYCNLDRNGAHDVNSVEDLLNMYPHAVDEFVTVCANGALKYLRDNWKKGFPVDGLLDSFLRHYRKFLAGESRDVIDDGLDARWETDKKFSDYFNGDYKAFVKRFETHHLAHCIWNLMVIIELN